MLREKYIGYSTSEDFVLDNEFYGWVMHPDKDRNEFWNTFMQEHPEKQSLIRDAAFIIKAIQPIETEIPQKRLNNIHNRIFKSKSTTLQHFPFLKYAALIALLISIGTLIRFSVQNNQFPIEATSSAVLKGKIILANGSTREFETEQTTIKQTSSGHLTINNDTIDTRITGKTLAMNQIIIPYGKHSEITLADGTHIWLNSGSQLSYPTQFKPGSREVFLQGEAFFDVTTDPNKPFYVITREVKIKVVGTKFNVSSYSEDKTVQTVLIQGKISAGKNKLFGSSIDLIPGERMTYDKNDESLLKDKVEVTQYASWINGYLIFNNEPISTVFKKIERFYNRKIVMEEKLNAISFSGKLDLKDKIEDVLENISFGSSLRILENNGLYIIKRKPMIE